MHRPLKSHHKADFFDIQLTVGFEARLYGDKIRLLSGC